MNLKVKKYGVADIISIPFSYTALYSAFIAVLKIAAGIVPIFNMLAVADFINATVELFNHKVCYSKIILSITFVVLCTAYLWLSPHIVEVAEAKLENMLRENFRVSLVEKVASLKYNYIENQDSWDLISRVCKEPEKQCTNAFSQLFDMVALIINVLGILFVLLMQVWWTAVFIVLISVPLFLIALKAGKASYEASRMAQKYYRRVSYLSEVLNGREAVEERALFQYSGRVNDKYRSQYEKFRKVRFRVNLKWFAKAKLSGIITAVLSSVIIVILVFPVRSGKLTIGLFISIVSNVITLIQSISWQLPKYVDGVAKNKEYLVDLTSLVKLQGKAEYLDKPCKTPVSVESLEFKNVSFKYPGTDRFILKGMNFKIEEGKHYAFVGINGAGKTTITKLITGLYEDFTGEILINNLSIKNYSQSQLKSMFSVVYQDFAKFYISLKDNVALGDVNGCSNDRINEALDIIDLKEAAEHLPNGLNSNLGKINEDGVDLSGGQWQRTAMARAIVSPASLRILDEPTAALDPISESHMYERFEKISRGRTTIFISHRLGSTKIADEIFVIDGGRVIEKGSFDELMKLNGTYARMFESQRSWYLDNND